MYILLNFNQKIEEYSSINKNVNQLSMNIEQDSDDRKQKMVTLAKNEI